MKTILAISGSDTLSGGGLQADLRTFFEHHIKPKQLLTCMVTVEQESEGVTVYDFPVKLMYEELNKMNDVSLDGIKVGMLANLETAQAVSSYLETQVAPIVLDPVLALKESQYTGNSMIIPFFKEQLLPQAIVTTPNLREAELLSGMSTIQTVGQMKEAAKYIFETGVDYVVVKGGERIGGDKAIDLLYDGSEYIVYDNPVIRNGYINGAGCTFASAICANIVNGLSVDKAVFYAKTFVYQSIKHGIPFMDDLGNVWQYGHRLDESV